MTKDEWQHNQLVSAYWTDKMRRMLGAKKPATRPEVIELALCEQEHLVLRPGQLYRFTALPGCQRCNELFSRGKIPPFLGTRPSPPCQINTSAMREPT